MWSYSINPSEILHRTKHTSKQSDYLCSHTKSLSYQYLKHQSAHPMFEYSLKILTHSSPNEIGVNPIEWSMVWMERRVWRTWRHDYVYLTMFKQHINLVAFCSRNDFRKLVYEVFWGIFIGNILLEIVMYKVKLIMWIYTYHSIFSTNL